VKSTPFSVDSILRSTAKRLALFGVLAILIVFFSQFFVLSYQSHQAACEIVSARFNQYMGPLSRELALGEQDVARSIFHDFIGVISLAGVKPELKIMFDSSSQQNFSERTCRASIFGATVMQPVSFAGKNLALITGRVTYFPTIPLILFIGAVIATLVISIRSWALRLIQRIQELLISPIKELSTGQEIENTNHLPIEVREVSRNISTLKMKLTEEGLRVAELAKEKQVSEMVVQVAHDIQSPLTILDMLDRDNFKFTDENRALMIAAARRIQGIGQSLIQKYRIQEDEKIKAKQSVSLASVVTESIVSEKRAIADPKGIEISMTIDPSARNGFVSVPGVDLGRLMSNLIDNAIDSFHDSGLLAKVIKVCLTLKKNEFEIEVSDNGRGISPEVLPTLAQKGTTSKTTGLGLGLYSARSLCEAAGGKLDISSQVGVGTTVTLKLPQSKSPKWFTGQIKILQNHKVVLIDDDETIHRFWQMRLKDRPLHRFYSGEDLKLKDLASDSDCLFLVDYQLGASLPNGIDVIKSLKIQGRSILVTSRFDDPAIQKIANEMDLKIMPKQLLGTLDFNGSAEVAKKQNGIDLVLIDDDSLIHQMWEMDAKDENLSLSIFDTVEKFLAAGVPKETPIFLDQHLGNGVLGTKVASQIWDRGYSKIHLASAYSKIENVPDFITSVRSKDFPDHALLTCE
jgi:signal transduction histidine kinase